VGGLDPIVIQVVIGGLFEVFALPIAIFVLEKLIGARLDKFDHKRDEARHAQAESDRKAIEQREAERTIILAMSHTMLLDNYEKRITKGCYTVEEREVYHKLYEAYKSDGGNSVIDEIAPRIRKLPLEPPKNK
jgi:hypothetical protein